MNASLKISLLSLTSCTPCCCRRVQRRGKSLWRRSLEGSSHPPEVLAVGVLACSTPLRPATNMHLGDRIALIAAPSLSPVRPFRHFRLPPFALPITTTASCTTELIFSFSSSHGSPTPSRTPSENTTKKKRRGQAVRHQLLAALHP